VRGRLSKLNFPAGFKEKLAEKACRRLTKKTSLKDLLKPSSTNESASGSKMNGNIDLYELDIDEVKKD